MRLTVVHIDGAGHEDQFDIDISLPLFLKHGALAGQGPGATFFPTLTRAIGLLLYYQGYIQVGPGLTLTGFTLPPAGDPTELGDFSTIVGKAFADILAKRTLGAPFTFTYEAALSQAGLPIIGQRPDFYCPSPHGQFSLESKGRKGPYVSQKLRDDAKEQSRAGDLEVNFSYASVSFDLYDDPQCLFCDPVIGDAPPNNELHRLLAMNYYEHITRDVANRQRTERRFEQREFFAYGFQSQWGRLHFLVDKEIEKRLQTDEVLRGFEPIGNERFYIDRDGIGVSLD